MKRSSAGVIALSLLMIPVLLLAGCGTAQTSQANNQQADDPLTPPTAAAQDLPTLVAGNTSFTLDLFKAVRSDCGNVVLSPYSVSTALAMAYAGANGATATQMAEVLLFGVPRDRLPAAFHQLAQNLSAGTQTDDGGQAFQLSVANSIWGQEDFSFLPAFLKVLQQQYDSPLRKVDFAKSSEAARVAINDWAKEETKGKIPDLLPAGSIDAMTRLVLANAVYFKADWLSPFSHEGTNDVDFHLASGATTTVPTMNQTASFGYAKTDGWEAVELPYQGGRYSMVALLPQADPDTALHALTTDSLSALLKQLAPKEISLSLPKWTYKSSFELKAALSTLGMQNAFSGADFSGMDGRMDLAIDDVYHKAFVAVDEKGTEAAAATGVVMRVTAVLATAPQVSFDRPFIYVIRDQQTGTILFIGQVADPGAASAD